MVNKFKMLLLPLILLSSCTNNTPKEEVEIVISAFWYGHEIKETINNFLEENKLDNVKVRIEDWEGDGIYFPYKDFQRDINITNRTTSIPDYLYGFATELDQKYIDIIDETVDKRFKEFGIIDGKYIGIPIAFDNYALYYNSSFLSNDDVKSIEILSNKLEEKQKFMSFSYQYSYCAAPIAEAFGYISIWKDIDEQKSVLVEDNLNSEIGLKSLAAIKELMSNPYIVNYAPQINSDAFNDYIVVISSGGKETYNRLLEKWGTENVSCAKLPTINVDGMNKQIPSHFNPKLLTISERIKSYSKYKQDIIYRIIKHLTKRETLLSLYDGINNYGYPTLKDSNIASDDYLAACGQEISYWLSETGQGSYSSFTNVLNKLNNLSGDYTIDDLKKILLEYDEDNQRLASN